MSPERISFGDKEEGLMHSMYRGQGRKIKTQEPRVEVKFVMVV